MAPWSGEIRLDGEPIENLAPADRAAVLAYVDQDVFLFSGTVRDNMTLWDSTVSDAILIEALKDADIHAEIASRPGGLNAEIAEGGMNFSGGQRQRLEIARALAANPAVLVLDEATAALDPITELLIDGAIRRRGCACLIIAHRLSTIRDADEILVLDGGQVIERGSHAELIARGGAYASLIGATV
jgi:ABC-type multidrug transport system fused ATPase/permease subunit